MTALCTLGFKQVLSAVNICSNKPGKGLRALKDGFSLPRKLHRALEEGFSLSRKFHRALEDGFSLPRKLHRALEDGFSLPRKLHRALEVVFSVPGRSFILACAIRKGTFTRKGQHSGMGFAVVLFSGCSLYFTKKV